jgi:uncharacterized membrane protein YfcA
MALAAALGLVIGLIIGAVGAGGAVLAVPALVYAVGLDVHTATTSSLGVVACGAVAGAFGQARRGAVCWASAARLAAAAAAGGMVGALANRAVGGAVLLVVFSVVMLAAARATWRRAGLPAAVSGGCPHARAAILLPAGALIGALTGLVGVGGGFVVVPTLAIGLGFGLREAMGTSIVIVAIVSIWGLAAHLAAGSSLDLGVTAAMGAAALAGALVGPRLAHGVSTRAVGRGFSALLAAVAVGVAVAAIAGVGT